MAEIHDQIASLGGEVVRKKATTKLQIVECQLALGFMSDENTQLAFCHPMQCLTALPHREPHEKSRVWVRSTRQARLEVVPIQTVEGSFYGVPFGSRARMILLYLTTQALKTGERRVHMGQSCRQWLSATGAKDGGKNYLLHSEQERRIENCLIRFEFTGNTGDGRWQDSIIRGSFNPANGERFVELSEGLYRALREHPVPVVEAAVYQLANRSCALDVYLWLSYRLHTLTRPIIVTWGALHAQFGSEVREMIHFRPRFLRACRHATAVYPEARIDTTPQGLRLFPSPAPVPPRSQVQVLAVPDEPSLPFTKPVEASKAKKARKEVVHGSYRAF